VFETRARNQDLTGLVPTSYETLRARGSERASHLATAFRQLNRELGDIGTIKAVVSGGAPGRPDHA
jgi:hypothetical protein